MHKSIIALVFLFTGHVSFSQTFSGNKSVTYDECIAAYKLLDEKFENAKRNSFKPEL